MLAQMGLNLVGVSDKVVKLCLCDHVRLAVQVTQEVCLVNRVPNCSKSRKLKAYH